MQWHLLIETNFHHAVGNLLVLNNPVQTSALKIICALVLVLTGRHVLLHTDTSHSALTYIEARLLSSKKWTFELTFYRMHTLWPPILLSHSVQTSWLFLFSVSWKFDSSTYFMIPSISRLKSPNSRTGPVSNQNGPLLQSTMAY